MSLRNKRRIKCWDFAIEVPLYNSSIKITFTTDVGLYLRNEGQAEHAERGTVAIMLGDCLEEGLHLIFHKQADLPTLVHEATHAAINIAGAHDILPTPEHAEAFAYLLENIVKQLIECKKVATRKANAKE
jgi:hypothetical protein